jgi:hypothetical protein
MQLQQSIFYNVYFCAGWGKENYTLMTENLQEKKAFANSGLILQL